MGCVTPLAGRMWGFRAVSTPHATLLLAFGCTALEGGGEAVQASLLRTLPASVVKVGLGS